jgi:hypothetical protein
MASGVWASIYGYNTSNVRKALYGSVLVRDRVEATADLSAFTPFAADGLWLTGLLVQDGGTWYNLGAGESDGPKFTRNLDVEKTQIWQSRQPARTDITTDEGSITFGIAEQTPVTDNLEFDLPLTSAEDGGLGAVSYSKTMPNETEGRERQVVAIGVDKGGHYFADLFPRVSMTKFDDVEWNPKNPIVAKVTWDFFICSVTGFSRRRFREGVGWRGLSNDDS